MEKQEIIIFISSPNDLKTERDFAEEVIKNVDDSIGNDLKITLKTKRWESLPPSAERPQNYINENIGPYDLFLGIMGNRFGTKTDNAESGAQEEFEDAYSLWQTTGKPEIMFYFRSTYDLPKNTEQAEQLWKVMKFRDELSSKILSKQYTEPLDFERKLRNDLERKIKEMVFNPVIRAKLTIEIPTELKVIDPVEIKEVENSWKTLEFCSSFEPGEDVFKHKFNRVRIPSTRGWIKKKDKDKNGNDIEREELQDNFVYIIKDPIRPFGIQIGETRSMRHQGNPTAISDLTNLDLGSIKNMYPLLQVSGFKWIRMVLAELSTDPKILNFIHDNDPDPHVKSIAAKNPSSSSELQKEECIFCKDQFLNLRLRSSGSEKTRIIHNDFPYGPYCHYVAIPARPVHAWEEFEFADIYDLNLTVWKYLNYERTEGNWKPKPAGILIGLNSTIRHLVLGTRTLTSAGASIPHIHKQIWGMVPGINSLGNYLNSICKAHEGQCDYLGAYLEFLEKNKMVLFQDDHVVLYVPFGQISIHELQIMMKKPGKSNYLDLSKSEVTSLSKAEAIAIKFLKELQINSFNEVMISLPFDTKSTYFRLVICFITREVDLAVSELNQLYVVDKHPENTRDLLAPIKESIIKKIEEVEKLLPH